MVLQDNLLRTEYRVPMNFIPGQPYYHETPHSQPTRRRAMSLSQKLAPLSNYIKRFKSSDVINKQFHFTTEKIDKKVSLTKSLTKVSSADEINKKNITCMPLMYGRFSEKNKQKALKHKCNFEGTKNNCNNIDRVSTLSASLPILNQNDTESNNSSDDDERTVFKQVQNELRNKLPKTFYATASMGVMNPMSPVSKDLRSPMGNNTSIFAGRTSSIDIGRLKRLRSLSLFSNVKSSLKWSPETPPKSPRPKKPANSKNEASMTSSKNEASMASSIFTRAQSYKEGRHLHLEEERDSITCPNSTESFSSKKFRL